MKKSKFLLSVCSFLSCGSRDITGVFNLKRFVLRIAAIMLAFTALFSVFVPSVFATGTTANHAASFKMETDNSAVRAKDIITLTITLTNDSTKDINKLEFALTYDETRILGITPDYTTSINGIAKPNAESPVVLRQQGSTIKVYNYNPSDSTVQPTPLKAGQKLILKFPLVVSETAPAGEISFQISNAVMSDASGAAMTANICPPAKVTIKPVSNDATLSSLVVTVNNAPVNLTPAFSANVTEYTVTVGYSIPSFGIAAACTDSRASYSIVERPANDMLAVGTNTYKYLVTAEDKVTTKTYTLTIKRLAAGETTTAPTSTTTTTTTTSTTTAPTTVTTTAPITTPPTTESTLPTSSVSPDISGSVIPGDEPVKEGSTVTLNMASLIGIVAAAVALFLLAFSAGYITHKNASQPQKYSVEELMAAQERLEMQNRINAPVSDSMYQSGYAASMNSYQPTYSAAVPAAPPTYQPDSFNGYQPDISSYTDQTAYYQADEFTPQQDYTQQPVDTSGAYGLGSIDYAQPVNGTPSEYGQSDTYYYQ